jgi:hypothetical protein
MSQDVEEFIKHHGVKGMRWGVRKARSTVKTSSDYKKTAPHRGKKPSELTNKQLKAVNERINLEQNYRRLNPSKIKAGAEAATAIMALTGVGIMAYNQINSPAGRALIAKGKKAAEVALKKKVAV